MFLVVTVSDGNAPLGVRKGENLRFNSWLSELKEGYIHARMLMTVREETNYKAEKKDEKTSK